jgi:hypothetical protein
MAALGARCGIYGVELASCKSAGWLYRTKTMDTEKQSPTLRLKLDTAEFALNFFFNAYSLVHNEDGIFIDYAFLKGGVVLEHQGFMLSLEDFQRTSFGFAAYMSRLDDVEGATVSWIPPAKASKIARYMQLGRDGNCGEILIHSYSVCRAIDAIRSSQGSDGEIDPIPTQGLAMLVSSLAIHKSFLFDLMALVDNSGENDNG